MHCTLWGKMHCSIAATCYNVIKASNTAVAAKDFPYENITVVATNVFVIFM